METKALALFDLGVSADLKNQKATYSVATESITVDLFDGGTRKV